MDDAERAEELAQNESYDVLWSALYSALEADLSGLGWPGNSRNILNPLSDEIETLIKLAEGK